MKDLTKEEIWTARHTLTKGAGLKDQCRLGWPLVITKSIAEHLDRMLEGDEEVSTMEFHYLIAKKFGKQAYAFI